MGAFQVLLIVNPGARQVAAQRELPALVQAALREHDVASDLLLTAGPGEAEGLARRGARQGYDAVVVAGGDGTVNEVVNGMAGSGVPLGLVPLGTANVLGEVLGLRAGDIDGACRLVARGVPRAMDLGNLNGRRFATMAGIGLDAVICAHTDSQWKQWLGKLAFVGQSMETLATLRPWSFEAEIDGQPFDGEMWCLFICNTPHYTWRIQMVPGAREDDGQLEFVLMRRGRRDELQRAIASLFVRGEPAERIPHMQVIPGRRLELRTGLEAPWQVDGEVGGVTPVTCGVEPGALLLISRERGATVLFSGRYRLGVPVGCVAGDDGVEDR
jgi:YegS/Rv2252/BmrU family lipid kinase